MRQEKSAEKRFFPKLCIEVFFGEAPSFTFAFVLAHTFATIRHSVEETSARRVVGVEHLLCSRR